MQKSFVLYFTNSFINSFQKIHNSQHNISNKRLFISLLVPLEANYLLFVILSLLHYTTNGKNVSIIFELQSLSFNKSLSSKYAITIRLLFQLERNRCVNYYSSCAAKRKHAQDCFIAFFFHSPSKSEGKEILLRFVSQTFVTLFHHLVPARSDFLILSCCCKDELSCLSKHQWSFCTGNLILSNFCNESSYVLLSRILFMAAG